MAHNTEEFIVKEALNHIGKYLNSLGHPAKLFRRYDAEKNENFIKIYIDKVNIVIKIPADEVYNKAHNNTIMSVADNIADYLRKSYPELLI